MIIHLISVIVIIIIIIKVIIGRVIVVIVMMIMIIGAYDRGAAPREGDMQSPAAWLRLLREAFGR